MNENTTNVKSTLYSKRVCWCIAEMAVPYSPLAITHILLHKMPIAGMDAGVGIPLAETRAPPTLEPSEFLLQRGPSFPSQTSGRGLENRVLKVSNSSEPIWS
jgi:hypothetical protein